nr:hypothetical protein [Spiroplasma poulsonii]
MPIYPGRQKDNVLFGPKYLTLASYAVLQYKNDNIGEILLPLNRY